MPVLIDTRVGPFVQADGNGDTPLRQDRTAGLVVTDGHGRYYEQAARGGLFTVSTAAVGITAAAGNVSPLGAAGTPIVGIFNPVSSGKNAVIVSATCGSVSSATTSVPGGAIVWNVAPAVQAITQTGTAPTNNSTLRAAGSSMIGLVNQAATGSTAFTMLRPMYAAYAFVLLTTSGTNTSGTLIREDTAGEIIVPPGGAVGLAVTAAGTTWLVVASITWEEVAV